MLSPPASFTNAIICLNVQNTQFAPSFFPGLKVIISLRGRFDCQLGGQALTGLRALVLNRQVSHAVAAPNAQLLMYYLDYHSPLTAILSEQLASQPWLDMSQQLGGRSLLPLNMACIPPGINMGDKHGAVWLLELLFSSSTAVLPVSERFTTCIRFVEEHLHEHLSLAQLAQQLSLSVERTRHVFEETMNISFSQYVLWMRLRAVIEKALHQQQQPLSKAALECSFTDQSHFSRIFKRTFGIQPRHVLLPNSQTRILVVAMPNPDDCA